MNKFKELRMTFYQKVFGLILLAIFILLTLSSISYSEFDPYFGYTGKTNYINNNLGFVGAYYAGTLEKFVGKLQFLIPIFFLIFGIKKIIGIKTNFFFFHFLSLTISIIFLSFLITILTDYKNEAGLITYNILLKNFNFLLNEKIYYFLFILILGVFGLLSLIFGLTLKFHILTLLTKILIKILGKLLFIKKIFSLLQIYINKKNVTKNEIKNKLASFAAKEKKEPKIYAKDLKNNYLKDRLNYQKKESFYNNNEYSLPPLSLLKNVLEKKLDVKDLKKDNEKKSVELEKILKEFGVEGKIIGFKTGPIVTLYEFNPAPGIKTSKVVGLAEDIARSMSSMSTRISSQPGKSSIGIEIPNQHRQQVNLGELLRESDFTNIQQGIILALGKNIDGEKKFTDLEKMPHLLIAGTTGSGKSVGINSMILSILFRFKPSECKLILIDPKMLELSIYEDIPHLLTPVVTDPKKAVFALKWVVREMENRYRTMSSAGVKNIQNFNNKVEKITSEGKKIFRQVQTGIDKETRKPIIEKQEIPLEKMPLIVVVIDEMADLMMVAGKEVESLVQRLAQMARASGIHLITATQRPSVDVITGTIKANFPSRLSFRVASRFDSRTILNEMGAEQLLGSGDMLFLENGANIVRLHGAYVSEEEIHKVVNFINTQSTGEAKMDITINSDKDNNFNLGFEINTGSVDDLYEKAVSIVIEKQKASTSYIQRYLQIGYNRAARIIEQMEKDGIVSEANHIGKRNILKK